MSQLMSISGIRRRPSLPKRGFVRIGATSARWHARAGSGLLVECRTLDGCDTGKAKITRAYDLPCERIIHAVGPVYWQDEGKAGELLRGCYVSALELAREHGLRSVAFSCISTGIYGYPSGAAAEVACRAVREWLLAHEEQGWGGLERVIFCIFEPKDERAYETALP